MTRRRKVLLGGATMIVVLLVLAAAGAWWVLATAEGARWSVARLEAALPGELDVDAVTGTLRGPLRLEGVRYRSDHAEVDVARVDVEWSLRALARRRIDVRRLDASGVRVRLAARERAVDRDTLGPELPDIDLPLDVMLASGSVRDLRIAQAGATDSGVVIDDVTLRSAAFRDTLRIGSLAVRGPRGTLEVHGGARPGGRYAVDLATSWFVRDAERGDLRGEGRLVGTLDTLRVLQTLAEPFAARVDLTVTHPLRGLGFAGRIEFSGLDVERLGESFPTARTRGVVDVAGRLDGFESRGRGTALTDAWGPWNVTFRARHEPGRLVLHEVGLVRPDGGPARAWTKGAVTFAAGTSRFDLSGGWRAVPWPLEGTAWARSPSGTFRIAGTPERWTLAGAGDLRAVQEWSPPSQWTVHGIGNTEAVTLDSIRGRVLDGTAHGHGTIRWGGGAEWEVTLAARDLDPSAAWRGYPGRIAFGFATRGRATPEGADGVLSITDLTGTLRDQPTTGRAAMRLVPGGFDIDTAEVSWGPNRAGARGLAAESWDLTWSIEAPDVALIDPRGGGRLVASGAVAGSRDRPQLLAKATGDSLRWASVWLTRLAADVDVRLDDRAASRLSVEAEDLHFPKRTLDRAAMHADGRLGDHRLVVAVTSRDDSLGLEAAGGLEGERWSGRLTRLDVASHETGSWGLEAPVPVSATETAVAFEDLCLRSGAARACASFEGGRTGPWSGALSLEAVPLSLLDAVAPSGLAFTGTASGRATARGGGPLIGEARIEFGPGEMSYPTRGDDRATVPIEPSTLEVAADAAGIRARADVSLGATASLEGAVRLPPARGADRSVEGEVHVAVNDLAVVQAFVPEIANATGTMKADLRVLGTTSRPRWVGDATLAGSAEVPRLGITLRDVACEAHSDEAGVLRFRGGATSEGRVEIEGSASFGDDGIAQAEARLTGRDVLAADTKDLTLVLSPDVRLTRAADSIVVLGSVTIPRADLRSRPEENEAIAPSPDFVFLNESPDTLPQRIVRVHSEVRLVLEDDVRVRVSGLDAKMTGSLLLIEVPGRPTAGSGQVRVTQGTYRAYGQDLTIERGRLIFAGGPVANPGLDLRTSRRAPDGVVAGFEVQGTLAAPRFSLFSEPPMSDREALSYVLLGRPLDSTNQSQQGIVTDAANSLGVQGGSYIAGTLARQIGLDDAHVESRAGEFEESTLMLGTYLSPRVYVNYGVGILDQVSTLRVQYFIDRHWTLQAETGPESSAQFLYTVERGK